VPLLQAAIGGARARARALPNVVSHTHAGDEAQPKDEAT
jgi:hypothetical protein